MSSIDTTSLAPGYRLDRYELLGPLASGGMASVWIARQIGKHGFEKLVAIKTILQQYAADERFRQMFLDEARIASRIEHFNVARILDLGEEHDVLYLVMEYVDGDSLSKLRRACTKTGATIPPGVLLRIMADACSGLHEAHELRGEDGRLLDIVHRDISPHNVLVSTKGAAKVIDFGIAKARDRMAGETHAGVLKGKIQYMAPEQALGRNVDRRADLWSVGATLYHLLAGKPAYDADNTLATLHMLTSGRPPVPLPRAVHPAISALVHKALSNPPEARFQSAAQMRDAIEDAMIAAKATASATDVAAFMASQLEERLLSRRHIVDTALAAAAERQRVEDVARPHSERTGSGLTGTPSGVRGTGSGVLRPMEPREVTPSASTTHAGTMAAEVIQRIVGRRSGWVIALLALGLVVLVTVGVSAVREPLRRSRTAAAGVPSAGSVASTSAVGARPPASAMPAPSSSIPEFSLSDLPKASDSPKPEPAPAGAPAPPPRSYVPPPPRQPPSKKKIDDGF